MPTILVVDDSAVDRKLAGGLLENAPGVQVCYAKDGNEALLEMGNALPDLVLTDLQMPHVDGLQLVNSIGEKYPELPVVLMTAHGSENIAAQALASGAASFVPKNELAESLVETVMHILTMADSDSRYRRLIQCATRTEFEFNLENDPSIIEPLIDLVQQIVSSQALLNSSSGVRMGVALEHALFNAMIRGNLEISRDDHPVLEKDYVIERARQDQFKDRRVYFRVLVTPEVAEFEIRDDGPGFDQSKIPERVDADNFRDGIGRGLVLIQAFMDNVQFSDGGRELKMSMSRTLAPANPR